MAGALANLAALAGKLGPNSDDIVLACQIVRDAIGAEDAYVLQAGDPHYIRVGSPADPLQYEVKQKGYWLIWRDLVVRPEVSFVGFTVADRLVSGIAETWAGSSATHVASILLPTAEGNSELLVIRGPWPNGPTPESIEFLQSARVMLAHLVGKVLDLDRESRLRTQLNSLADISRAFNESTRMDEVVQDLANAIAKASGFSVTIWVVDETQERVVEKALNVSRYSDTETAQSGLRVTPSVMERIHEVGRLRRPILVPDISDPASGLDPRLVQYYERAHLVSAAYYPILFQDQMLGAVFFTSANRHDFPESEVTFLDALVSQAASSIKGLRLYHDLEGSREELRRYADELEGMNRAQHFLARTDALTGIPNRRYLEEVLQAETAGSRRYGRSLSVVMADIDLFKNINDCFGHQCGDEALRLVAKLARETCRSSDFVGRWGGDEFLFILVSTDGNDGRVFAERFRVAVAESHFAPMNDVRSASLTISAGVSQATGAADETGFDLVEWADKALYQAKQAGRNRVTVSPPRAIAA